jgi:hypothetical protein
MIIINSYCCSLENENPTNESWLPANALLTENDSSDGPSLFSISSKLLVSSSLVNGGTIGTDAKENSKYIQVQRKFYYRTFS